MILDLLNTKIGDFITEVLFPIVIAFITYYLISKRDELKNRGKISRLGVAVIESLLEEVNNGVDIFKEISKYNLIHQYYSQKPLPRKSWNGMRTISDEILLRIIEVSRNVKPDSFPPSQIRIHCKNYFDHMATNLDNCYSADNWIECAKNLAVKSKYLEAAQNVQKMLLQTENLLKLNSKKIFPK